MQSPAYLWLNGHDLAHVLLGRQHQLMVDHPIRLLLEHAAAGVDVHLASQGKAPAMSGMVNMGLVASRPVVRMPKCSVCSCTSKALELACCRHREVAVWRMTAGTHWLLLHDGFVSLLWVLARGMEEKARCNGLQVMYIHVQSTKNQTRLFAMEWKCTRQACILK